VVNLKAKSGKRYKSGKFYTPRWFTHTYAVTHPSANRTLRRVTTLIENNALPLSYGIAVDKRDSSVGVVCTKVDGNKCSDQSELSVL